MSLHSISMLKCLVSTPKELSGLSCVNNSCQPSVFHIQYIPWNMHKALLGFVLSPYEFLED